MQAVGVADQMGRLLAPLVVYHRYFGEQWSLEDDIGGRSRSSAHKLSYGQ